MVVSELEFEDRDSMMAECSSFTSIFLANRLQSTRAIVPMWVRVCRYTPSGSTRISYKPEDLSTSDSSKLTASCFLLDLLGVELGLSMFVVTAGYSMSEDDFFFRDRRLLAEF